MHCAASEVERTGVFLIAKLIWLTRTCDFTVYSFAFANFVCVGGCAAMGAVRRGLVKTCVSSAPNAAVGVCWMVVDEGGLGDGPSHSSRKWAEFQDGVPGR